MAFNGTFERWLRESLTDLKRATAGNEIKIRPLSDDIVNSLSINTSKDLDPVGNTNTRGGICETKINEFDIIREMAAAEGRRQNGGVTRSLSSRAFRRPDYWQLAYNEDDNSSRISVEDSAQQFGSEELGTRVAGETRINFQSSCADRTGEYDDDDEDDDDDDNFYEMPNEFIQEDSRTDTIFEPDLNFRFSGSLDFSETADDIVSISSEPQSFAVDPERFRIDFQMENEFVAIDRIDSNMESSEMDRSSSSKSHSTSESHANLPVSPPRTGIINSIFKTTGRDASRMTKDGFNVRYVKAKDESEDNYIDDDIGPTGLTPEEFLDSELYDSDGMLPMSGEDMAMDSEAESILNCGLPGGPDDVRNTKSRSSMPGVDRGSLTADTAPIVGEGDSAKRLRELRLWALSHRSVIGVAVAAGCGTIAIVVLIVYLIVTYT